MARQHLMSGKDSVTGARYTWTSGATADFAGVSYPGPNAATDVYVQSLYDDGTGTPGPAGPTGPAGSGATLVDKAGASLTADPNINTSGSIEWRRVDGKNVPMRRGVANLKDYGARAANGTALGNMTAGSNVCGPLTSVSDFQDGDYVVYFGAGAAHTMLAPPAPSIAVVGPTGSTLREYKLAYLDSEFGLSAASPTVSVANGPDVLGDPLTWRGMGVESDGGWVRMIPKYVEALHSTTSNVAVLSGLQTFDSVAGADGETVMLLGQTAPAENGPWVQHAGAWTRPPGFAVSADLAQGMFIHVQRGGVRTRTLWQLTTAGAYTLGTTALAFAQLDARVGVVWHRAGGSGNWEIAGGFLLNSYLYGLTLQFNDYGFRPSGISSGTIPNTTPPAAPLARLLRTRIVSGGGTTSLTLADTAETTRAAARIYHDNSTPWEDAQADAIANKLRVEIPDGEWLFFKDIIIENPGFSMSGAGSQRTTLRMGNIYGIVFGDNSARAYAADFTVAWVNQALPAGDMRSVSHDDGSIIDQVFDGAGVVTRSSDSVFERIMVQGCYGSGFLIRASAGEGTNANRCKLDRCEAASCHGNGFQASGGDGNICTIIACSAVNASGIGFDDASFLGCTWIGNHNSASLRRAYNSRNDGASKACFIGNYAESGSPPIRITWPGIWIGGCNGVGQEPNSTGWSMDGGRVVRPFLFVSNQASSIWSANNEVKPGSYGRPTRNNGFVYKAIRTATGTRLTGPTEPAWPLTPGATVVDNQITWQNTGTQPMIETRLGLWQNNLLLDWIEEGNPKGIAHSLQLARDSGYIKATATGGDLNGDGWRWQAIDTGNNLARRGNGHLKIPTFLLVNDTNGDTRRFGWCFGGAPAHLGIYSRGDLFVETSGTGRTYMAAADFGIGSTWAPNTAYQQGQVVYPTVPDGFAYVNLAAVSQTNTATSHASVEPTWPSGASTVVDGTCIWKRHGAATPQWEVSVSMADGAHLANADATIAVAAGNKRTLHVNLTANRTIRLSATGATKGEVIQIIRLGAGAFTLTIKDDVSGTDLYVFPSGQTRAADFSFDATNWQGPLTGGGSHTKV